MESSYIDSKFLIEFLTEASKRLTYSKDDKRIALGARKLAKMFQVGLADVGTHHEVSGKLIRILKKIKKLNLGIMPTEAICYSEAPYVILNADIESLNDEDYHDIDDIVFEIRRDAFLDTLEYYGIVSKSYPFAQKEGRRSKGGTIQRITRVDLRGTKFLTIINDEFQKQIRCDKLKPSWGLLFKVAEGDGTSSLRVAEYKNQLAYLNKSNKCALYTQTGYRPQKILGSDGVGYIESVIPIKLISELALKRHIKRADK